MIFPPMRRAKAACATDARVSYAVLTPEGAAKLRAASRSHLRQIRELFGAEFNESVFGLLVEHRRKV